MLLLAPSVATVEPAHALPVHTAQHSASAAPLEWGFEAETVAGQTVAGDGEASEGEHIGSHAVGAPVGQGIPSIQLVGGGGVVGEWGGMELGDQEQQRDQDRCGGKAAREHFSDGR